MGEVALQREWPSSDTGALYNTWLLGTVALIPGPHWLQSGWGTHRLGAMWCRVADRTGPTLVSDG